MRAVSARVLALTFLLLSATEGRSADFQKGLDAARRGDFEAALREWTPLAEQGLDEAQFNLGTMYHLGNGVFQDYEQAFKWYGLAAEQEHANAQTNLGVLYCYGQGADQSNVYAYMWASMSAENGGENGAQLRDLIAGRMTPSQLEKAQDLGRECVAKDYKNC